MSQPIRISVRAAPAVVAWHIPAIEAGDPFAEVNANRSAFHLPDADPHHPSPALRAWIVEHVRQAIGRDHLKRWIIWPGGAVTSFIPPDLTPHLRPAPSKDHGDKHVR